jgi:hypothetical protein
LKGKGILLRIHLAIRQSDLAMVLKDLGELEEALELLRKAHRAP